MPAIVRLASRIAVVAACTLSVGASSLGAQSAPIVGTWNVEWELGRRMINGETTIITATGTMLVVASGDSLLATLTPLNRSDSQPTTQPPLTMGGRATPSGAVFTEISDITLNMNGEERQHRSVGTWTLEVNGTVLSGQTVRDIEGLSMDLPPLALKGTRAR